MPKSQISYPKSQINNQVQITNVPTTNYQLPITKYRSLFIPYWSPSLSETDMNYDIYYYFGIVPTAVGEIKNEVGLSNMPRIVESLKSKVKSRKKVVVRMLDSSINDALLGNDTAQKNLSENLLTILNTYAFSGIVIDLEVPFTFQVEKKGQITHFVQQICSVIKANYKTCDLLVYGDFSYRNRPYDLKELGKSADSILLMAYDFHKAGGEPGPNFPLARRSNNEGGPSTTDYGHSFKQMISNTLALVPKEKVEVVFGMYGYDWTLNEQGTPLKTAEALSLNEIRQRVAQNANRPNDIRYTLHENESREKSLQYVDSDGRNHVIWYEDEESVAIKTKYLLEKGVSRVSFWAQSYF